MVGMSLWEQNALVSFNLKLKDHFEHIVKHSNRQYLTDSRLKAI